MICTIKSARQQFTYLSSVFVEATFRILADFISIKTFIAGFEVGGVSSF